MESGWVSFAAVKADVGVCRVLEDYGVMAGLRRSHGEQYRGRCPIHRGTGEDAFHVHADKNAFQCFSCGAHGNVLDLVAALERCTVRQAALLLQQRYQVDTRIPRLVRPAEKGELVTKKRVPPELPFSLSGLDASHPYILSRGLRRETATRFGIGYYGGPGLLKNRLAIPIHDACGRLVAYCGRALSGEGPRYRFPAGFAKSAVLFNYHRAARLAETGVVVEGFFDCMRVHQAGFPSVVALMGVVLSAHQIELLVRRFRRIILMLDGDEAGRAGSRTAAAKLEAQCAVGQALVPPARQPDQMTDDEIQQILGKMF